MKRVIGVVLNRLAGLLAAIFLGMAGISGVYAEGQSLLNVSYDISRELYKGINAAFVKEYKAKRGADIELKQSHGGSSRQARAVADGLDADVVTLNQRVDVEVLVSKGLIPSNWSERFPNSSSPWTSITSFVVRKGNPKNIKDWDDLAKPDVKVVLVNPKTGGNGRYSYLAAYGYALKKFSGDEKKAQEFVAKIIHNAPVLDTGGRGATTTFVERGIGDVLLTFEAEAFLIQKELGSDKVEVVTPSVSVEADFPVAVVEKVTNRHGNTELAKSYIGFLFTEAGQEIGAQNYYRPRLASVAAKYKSRYKPVELVDVEKAFGGWEKAFKVHFTDGGIFDKIYTLNR